VVSEVHRVVSHFGARTADALRRSAPACLGTTASGSAGSSVGCEQCGARLSTPSTPYTSGWRR
jgi:hypothetical protein